jgi:hypothetical protein
MPRRSGCSAARGQRRNNRALGRDAGRRFAWAGIGLISFGLWLDHRGRLGSEVLAREYRIEITRRVSSASLNMLVSTWIRLQSLALTRARPVHHY